ncbi:MAG: bifunctional diaminohydroxyphosphoribosylaminopyrimidine deaminase/5-amino-6-(5-phosphoribosylamino)uracil reductase RibD [Burkholderiaceae bacterium]|nr:bifunctional diaminohydroxyphosphoribosylaminopyrimidine deaminase/5-amino-6-(5-phosphoribosylamino)uracil reductase RibD [Burkholderiaceae bacterium]
MPFNDADRARLHECLALAQGAIGLSDPNPRVGCVIASAGGRTLAQGFTQQAGGPHAEAAALADARASGADLRGATAWVSLEPCAHHGRTPPCCDALIDAGIARVVLPAVDPNPLVAGQGIARLRAAGVAVDLADGDIARAARELNIGFFSRMQRGRPWVRMKIAASLDGRTALNNGASQWITGEAARTDGHAWRKRASALLTGIGTVLEDNPRLDVRLVSTPRQPLRVIVDSRLQTPAEARILDAPGEVLVYTAAGDAARAAALQERGARLVPMAADHGKVDLPAMLADLAQRGVNELHVEAGHKLNGSLLREGLVDELLVYLAPKLVGIGREMAAFGPLSTLAEALQFEFTQVDRIGSDLRILARPPGRADFLDN